jgi:lysophospholipase L1-like esterase
MSRAGEPQFGVTKSLAFSATLIVLILGAAELLVRGWAFYMRGDAERWDAKSSTFVLEPGEYRSEYGNVARINSAGFVGAELASEGPDLWRIVAVGDSCTYGGGSDLDSYPALLEARLHLREGPGRRYEVVNAGISGLNSELALRRLRSRVLALTPDVVTLYIGWNDLMKFDPLAQVEEGQNARWSGVARALDGLWLVKGLRKLLFFHLRPFVAPPATGPESHTGRFAGFRPTLYERNLAEMIDAVQSIGARPLLVTLPTVVRPEMSVPDLRQARVMFPYFGSANAVGDFLDLLAAYNQVVRTLAAERNVPLVDLAKHFEAVDDITPYFFDTMHPDTRGRAVIAEQLLSGLEREGLLAPAPERRP